MANELEVSNTSESITQEEREKLNALVKEYATLTREYVIEVVKIIVQCKEILRYKRGNYSMTHFCKHRLGISITYAQNMCDWYHDAVVCHHEHTIDQLANDVIKSLISEVHNESRDSAKELTAKVVQLADHRGGADKVDKTDVAKLREELRKEKAKTETLQRANEILREVADLKPVVPVPAAAEPVDGNLVALQGIWARSTESTQNAFLDWVQSDDAPPPVVEVEA